MWQKTGLSIRFVCVGSFTVAGQSDFQVSVGWCWTWVLVVLLCWKESSLRSYGKKNNPQCLPVIFLATPQGTTCLVVTMVSLLPPDTPTQEKRSLQGGMALFQKHNPHPLPARHLSWSHITAIFMVVMWLQSKKSSLDISSIFCQLLIPFCSNATLCCLIFTIVVSQQCSSQTQWPFPAILGECCWSTPNTSLGHIPHPPTDMTPPPDINQTSTEVTHPLRTGQKNK